MLPDLTGKELVDRLPVIVSGAGVDQLLRVPKLNAGTGEAQASAVARVIEEWGLVDHISTMCFDTTASNSGRRNGACVLLEQKLNKDMLHLACRHHIFEIVLASVFERSMGQSSGPDVAIFKRFQHAWQFINHSEYETGADIDSIKACKESIVSFAINHLEMGQPRDDYRELLELAIIFMDDIPPRGVRFMAPGAMHYARWMAKAIYSFKMLMFKKQFSLTTREERGLRDICTFIVVVYLKAWYTAPFATSAPRNDLLLLQLLVQYEKENATVSIAASNKLSGQLWYLSEELVGLAFFDDDISVESKRNMVRALNEHVGMEGPPKRLQLDIRRVVDMSIADFVTKNTMKFFHCLGIQCEFLNADPDTWNDRNDYKSGQDTVRHLKVVNDSAERGVALIEEYNAIITKNEDQKQFLLQTVRDHRLRIPDCKKGSLKNL
jgi:hypothetical protein